MGLLSSFFGFVLMYIYEANQVKWQTKAMKNFFFLGGIFLLLGVFFTIKTLFIDWSSVVTYLGLILGFGNLFLLIHTLFFQFPFQETYVEQMNTRTVYREKMYALSRHPGVLWFILLFGSLVLIYPTWDMVMLALVQCSLNLGYIVLQDRWSFPILFVDYEEYCQTTPFLIPSTTSIHAALQSYQRR